MRLTKTQRGAGALLSATLLALVAACGSGADAGGPKPCPSAPGEPLAADTEPDFARYGFTEVAAKVRFQPGQEATLKDGEGEVTATLPKDFYTAPLEVELLLGDAKRWAGCAPAGIRLVWPYAFRLTDPATGKRVGRFDQPASVVIANTEIGTNAKLWTVQPGNPVNLAPATAAFEAQTGRLRATNANARIGWLTAVPAK